MSRRQEARRGLLRDLPGAVISSHVLCAAVGRSKPLRRAIHHWSLQNGTHADVTVTRGMQSRLHLLEIIVLRGPAATRFLCCLHGAKYH